MARPERVEEYARSACLQIEISWYMTRDSDGQGHSSLQARLAIFGLGVGGKKDGTAPLTHRVTQNTHTNTRLKTTSPPSQKVSLIEHRRLPPRVVVIFLTNNQRGTITHDINHEVPKYIVSGRLSQTTKQRNKQEAAFLPNYIISWGVSHTDSSLSAHDCRNPTRLVI